MAFLDIFKKKKKENVGGMEDFMTLIRVYFQSVLAANLGISNLSALPDLLTFKRTLHVATVNNKLGIGEKKACAKMLQDLYGISDNFFKEIDQSIKKGCRTQNDVSRYLYAFQGFTQDTMMLTTHSIEAIDGLLATQDYDEQDSSDDICVCTIKRVSDASYSRVLSGREVYENREAFGFEVRL